MIAHGAARRRVCTLAALVATATLARADAPGAPAPDAPAPSGEPAHDVADYALRASLDTATHRVHGEGTLTWRNASRVAVRELWVHLYLNAFQDGSVFLREIASPVDAVPLATPGRIDVRRFALREADGRTTDLWASADLHPGGDEDATDVRVPLPREVAPGEAITLELAWDDQLPGVAERTGYASSFHMVAQWFPKVARLEPDGRWAHFPYHRLGEFYADFGTYDVTLDVPQGFVVGATGPVTESRVENGRRVERHVQSDVHDFAWTAWDQWRSRSEVVAGTRVELLYPPGFGIAAERELRAIRFALPWMNARYGRYPYDVLTLVHPPPTAARAEGMEYPTLVTTRGRWFGPPFDLEIERTAVHELAHQWFQGMVATNEVDWPFLDEGLASFVEDSVMRAWRGAGDAVDLFGLEVGGVESVDAASTHDGPTARPAYAFASEAEYVPLVYERCRLVFGTLARVHGEDALQRALGVYAGQYRFAHPGPDELLATLAATLGDGAARTARAALFDAGWVDYVAGEVDAGPAAGGGFEGSVLVRRRGTLAFPVQVDLVLADGSRQRRTWDGVGSEARLPYRGAVALVGAVVDPDHAILLDDDPLNNFASAAGSTVAGAPRTFERALYWAGLLLQMAP